MPFRALAMPPAISIGIVGAGGASAALISENTTISLAVLIITITAAVKVTLWWRSYQESMRGEVRALHRAVRQIARHLDIDLDSDFDSNKFKESGTK